MLRHFYIPTVLAAIMATVFAMMLASCSQNSDDRSFDQEGDGARAAGAPAEDSVTNISSLIESSDPKIFNNPENKKNLETLMALPGMKAIVAKSLADVERQAPASVSGRPRQVAGPACYAYACAYASAWASAVACAYASATACATCSAGGVTNTVCSTASSSYCAYAFAYAYSWACGYGFSVGGPAMPAPLAPFMPVAGTGPMPTPTPILTIVK